MESTLAELIYPIRTILNFYIYFLITLYFWTFLTPKERISSRQAFLLTLGISILGMGIGLVFYSQYVLKIFLSISNYIIFTGFIYRDSHFRRTVVSLFYMVLLMLAEGILAAIMVLISGQSLPLLAEDPAFVLKTIPYQMVIYAMVYGVPSLIARKRTKTAHTLPFGLFAILPLSQVVMMGGFLYTLYVSERILTSFDAVITGIMILVCVVTDLVFLHIVRSLIHKKQLEEQQTLQKRHYAALMEQQKNIRNLRHDIGNHLMTATVLAKEDTSKAEAYLQGLTNEFRSMTAIDFCENSIADAVLYGKATEASAAGVTFSVEASLSENLHIQETDLMSLLSNLLDNALEAAIQAEDPFVEVSIREKGGAVLIHVRNSFPANISPNLLRTGKKEKNMHGLGLQIVDRICRKYNGSFSHKIKDSIFDANAMLLSQSK